MNKLSYKVTLVAGLAVFTFGGASVLAVGANAHAEDATQTAATRQTTATEKQAAAQVTQTENRLKACQRHEQNIDATMSRIATRGDRQLDVFTKIADRTEAFYVKQGKTLSNYAALVADVSAKKTAALAAAAQIKANATAFKCDGVADKGEGAAFKTALKSEIAALKAYKTAVKNLIVGVKSVQSTTTSEGTK